MSDQLELMFDLLQQEVEKLTADLAREDSDDLLHSNNTKLNTVSENDSSLKTNLYNLDTEIERNIKKKISSNSIISLNNSNINLPLQPPIHQRSASHNEAHEVRNLDNMSHQKSRSESSRYVGLDSQDSNYLSSQDSKLLNIPSKLSNYQRIRTLSDSNNISDVAVPIHSPMLSPRTMTDVSQVLSSGSDDSDVSVSSSDDNSGSDNDNDNSPLMATSSNLLRNQSQNDLSNVQNSIVDDQKNTVSNDENSTISSPTNSIEVPIVKKKIKRTPTTGRGLGKSYVSSVSETSTQSYDTDDENRPLRLRSRSKVNDINLDKREEKPLVRVQESKNVSETSTSISYDTDDENRPLKFRSNSKAQDINLDKQSEETSSVKTQESKHASESSTTTSYDTADDENFPLRPRSNSKVQDINLDKQREEKQSVRSRANSKAQESKLDLYKDSSVRMHQTRRRSGSKERTSDDHSETSNSKEYIEESRTRERNSNDNKNVPIRSAKLNSEGSSGSRERVSDDKYDMDSQKMINEARTRVRSRIRESEDDEQTRSRNKAGNLSEKERMNARENLEERGSENNKNTEQDNDRGQARSKVRGEEGRGRAKSIVQGEEGRGRAKSIVRGEEGRGRAKSIVRGEEERGRAKSKVRGEEERERARSRVREEEERGRARSKVHEEEERGRARSKVRGEEERGRAKSKVRGEEERGRAKSKVRGEEERGRAKSKAQEERERARSKPQEEERGRARSGPKEREVEENSSRRAKSRTRGKEYELLDKEKSLRYRREKGEVNEEQRITEVKLTTQIFIENARQYRTLSITSTKTALEILNYFRNKDTISDSDSWTLFEVINEYGLERPIRDWEYIATVIGNWELNKQNAIVLKKYTNRSCLTLDGFSNAVPPMFGSLHLEIKKNKWQKRHFFIKDGAVYHCKDAKGNNETLLCSLANFDVYTFTKTVRKSPTKFIFALKSQEKIAMFENPDDYIRYLCADHLDKMKDWVLSLRAAKNKLLRVTNPERFEKTEKISTGLNEINGKVPEKRKSINQWENLRKHVRNSKLYSKSENNSPGPISNSGFKKKELSNGSSNNASGDQPFKEGSLLSFNEKNLPSKQVEPEGTKFMKGSLLASNDALFEQAKEREKLRKAGNGVGIVRDPSSPTFVNLNNPVKFNQGSLLGRNNDTTIEHNNNSNTSPTGHLVQIENGVNGVQFNKGSLLTKSNTQRHKNPSGTLLKIDAPISKNAVVQNILSPNGKPLLELDLKPDAAHTLALRNTNVTPLLSFVPGESNYKGVRSPKNNNNEKSETSSEYDSDE